jgi:hypothetical protein
VFAREENIDLMPGIKLRMFMVKYTADPFDYLNVTDSERWRK